MYEKQLMGRRPLLFRHAPPLTGLDDYSTDELPKLPFKGAKPWQRSVYYFWWIFLKEHEGYMATCAAGGKGPCAKLYEDFGDVRGDNFMRWWKKTGRYLFCEPQEEPIHVHPSAEFRMDDPTRVVVSIPVNRDVDDMLAELKQLLKPLRKQLPVRHDDSQPRYPVLAKPVLSSLHQHWEVWQLRKQHPDKPLHEIGDLAGLVVDDKEGADPKQVKAITVSRYLKQARCLIEHVGRGQFPITRPEQLRLVRR